MLIAHGPIAVLATKIFGGEKFKQRNIQEKISLILLSLFIGILPDFDMFYLAARSKPYYLHHTLITHTPIFWIITSGIIYLVLEYFKFPRKKDFRILIPLTILVSSISHMVSDVVAGHIMFFTPFYSRYITLLGNTLPDNIFAGYLGSPMFGIEILIISIFLVYLIFEFTSTKLTYFLLLPIFYVIFNFIIYSQTYQVDLFEKKNGYPIYDSDMDGLSDSYDYDYDNNFVDNFNQVSKESLLTEFEKIRSNTQILSSRNRNIVEDIKYVYGGHTLLRAILQSYAQTHNYLPPVIHSFMFKNNIDTFSEGIFQFLLSTNRFKNVKDIKQIEKGSLVIRTIDNQNRLGIILRNGNIYIEDYLGIPTEIKPTEIDNTYLIFD